MAIIKRRYYDVFPSNSDETWRGYLHPSGGGNIRWECGGFTWEWFND